MSDESKLIKTLLLKEELETLEQLKTKVLSKEQFTIEVSSVLAKAIARSQTSNKRLHRVLKEPINSGIQKAFADNKQSMIDSLLPIMGQLIRKTVANSIRQFVTDINRALEVRFSFKYLKWRFQAWKAGISFPEMLFQKTIRYQVLEIFLVDKETGLLIEHAGSQELLKNKDAISSMLTAIQDFIGDSLIHSDSELMSVELGDNDIFITNGPHAYLATVIKGKPTERLKERLQELIESIHAEFSDEILNQNHFGSIPEVHETLEEHLVIKSIDDTEKHVNWWPWLIGILLILGYFSYKGYQRHSELQNIRLISHAIPGLYVQSVTRTQEGISVKALKDPLADISSLDSNLVTIDSRPFVSLDKEMIELRVKKLLQKYPHVDVSYSSGTIFLRGNLQTPISDNILHMLPSLPGVDEVINETQHDSTQDIHSIFHSIKNLSQSSQLRLENNHVILTGEASHNDLQQFERDLKLQFPDVTFDFSQLSVNDATNLLIEQVHKTSIDVSSLQQSETQAVQQFQKLNSMLLKLRERQALQYLLLTGQSDCNANVSDEMSWKRVRFIQQLMISKGWEEHQVQTQIDACDTYTNPRNHSLRTVSLEVH